MALADVYDALTSKRSYKDAISHEDAIAIIIAEKGTHFDPDVVDVFELNLEIFRRIQMLESFKEHPESIDDILNRPHAEPADFPAEHYRPGRNSLYYSGMTSKIDIAEIQKAALRSIPLTFRLRACRTNRTPCSTRILEVYLVELGQERILEPLSYCLKELIINAQKANTKRLYFEEKGLDILQENDYEKGMRDFRASRRSESSTGCRC